MSKEVIYYEDIALNVPMFSRYYTLTEADIISFAQQWNPEPFHVDPQAAAQSPMGKIFAAGPHLIAIATKLTNEFRPRPETIAGMGWDELRFKTPAFAGDKLYVENTAINKRRSNSKPTTGIVEYQLRLLKGNGVEVLTYRVTCLMQCKNPPKESQ